MSYMYYYDRDGISYQELKQALGLSDNQLGPQLLWLKKNKYVKLEVAELDGKGISVYYITEKGKEVYKEIVSWIKELPLKKEVCGNERI